VPDSSDLEMLARAGDYAAAARLARALNRHYEAARFFAQAGMPYESAVCYLAVGESEKCLDQLLTVPSSHRQYRQACVHAVKQAHKVGRVDDRLVQALQPFTSVPPTTPAEAEAYDVIARYLASSGDRGGAATYDRTLPLHGGRLRATGDVPVSPPATPATPVPPAVQAVAASVSSHALTEGSTIDGRFRLGPKIGQGGMAAVFQAHDLELGEDIAIKFFSHATADEALVNRFRQEVAILRRLNHPNIVRLFEFGTYGDYKFVVMELLRGQDLGAVLQAGSRTLPVAEGIAYLVQACEALQLAHDNGIIHRDIKPGNLFVTDSKALKVMDFGISKRIGAPSLTQTGWIAGTPEYMAPEQVSDFRRVTHLADLYALGCVAYRMFTGRPPFVHPDTVPLLVMHVSEPPTPPRKLNPGLPQKLEDVILRLLAKPPEARVQSCRALADLLRA
jgi:serine/threonine-protein kinase